MLPQCQEVVRLRVEQRIVYGDCHDLIGSLEFSPSAASSSQALSVHWSSTWTVGEIKGMGFRTF